MHKVIINFHLHSNLSPVTGCSTSHSTKTMTDTASISLNVPRVRAGEEKSLVNSH